MDVDVAVLTALEKIELDAVLKLDTDWRRIDVKGYGYWLGNKKLKSGRVLKIICGAAERMGVSAASELTSRVAYQFRPKFMVMTGICAGIRGKVKLGDIVVADFSWDWGAGKVEESEDGNLKFSPDPHQIALESSLKKLLKGYVSTQAIMQKIYMEWPARRGDSPPTSFIAPMACGSQVLANAEKVNEIAGFNRKVMAIDMESYGFMNVCNSLGIKCMVVKGVCDFADREKDDGAQDYAAFGSSQFAFDFVCQAPDDFFENS